MSKTETNNMRKEQDRILRGSSRRIVLKQHEKLHTIITLTETKFDNGDSIYSVFVYSKKSQIELSQEVFTSLVEAQHEYDKEIK